MRSWIENADLIIESEGDWSLFTQKGFDLVVDPLIYRTAEVFIRGRSGHAHEDEQLWSGISENLRELINFFDLLVFSRSLPMIDYGYTFSPDEGFDVSRLYEMCNAGPAGKVLTAVSVRSEAYENARTRAIEALNQHGLVEPTLRDSIVAELTAFDHQWRPHLGELESEVGDADSPDRLVATFVYGGLLFGIYAKRIGAGHILPPKRARLQTATALDAKTARFEDEQALFNQLSNIMQQMPELKQRPVEVSAIPPVLPYLLSRYDPSSPQELLLRALELRESDMAADFRTWRCRLITDWRENAIISEDTERELRRMAQRIEDHLTPYSPPEANTSLTAFLLKALPMRELWNWTLSNVPGRNHMKLLFRLHVAAGDRARAGDFYGSLEYKLRKLWQKEKG